MSTEAGTSYQQQQSPQVPAEASQSQPTQPQTRQEIDQAAKNRTLAEFMLMLDDYEPLIPSEITDYYLQRVGLECEDVRLKRLLSLAAQKFVSDLAADAFQHARIRTNPSGARGRAPLGLAGKDKTKTTLMMEDLTAALSDHGVSARKPEYYL
ncbi:transcription initiation factor IID, TAF10 subunit [Sistotremastrum niveocremeum HHB9708]|uniref:Transcription initiation factor TFIID subunit 10 n=2 Tax=Sistotremastraceae TaxID=3402574 RepID=A0A164VTI5_9AGAM|nr:transcription initiation factor IID, TAF10 subunit [Sistotremastrum niveocremeum HHB9708]KZT43119.1 transcription initiation factor IID, TAF10 subunit [Sistotremastrum suecicum HHB10207 ss-3]